MIAQELGKRYWLTGKTEAYDIVRISSKCKHNCYKYFNNKRTVPTSAIHDCNNLILYLSFAASDASVVTQNLCYSAAPCITIRII